MAQLAKAERLDKLQQTLKVVEDDYLRLLGLNRNGYNGHNIETDESGDEDEDDGVDDRPTKKVKTV